MDTNERFARIATASPEILKQIDGILEDKTTPKPEKDCRLITIMEACRMLGMKYPTFHRAVQEGCFDVVSATGKNLIKESSVVEFSLGKRGPTEAGLALRAERNRRRRLARRQQQEKTSRARVHV